MSLWKKIAFSAILTLALLCFLEGIASFLVAYSESREKIENRPEHGMRERKHCRHDADLGWMNLAGVHIENIYGEGTSYTTNSQAFRATVEYTPQIPAETYRVICLGDSFTMGYGVDDDDTFPSQLESLSDHLQVVNMGLGGFGVDQNYLWYKRDGTKLDANLLLFCVIRNDFYRALTERFNNRYEKPLLEVVDGKLVVHNVPVPDTSEFSSKGASVLREFTGRSALARLLKRDPPELPESDEGNLPFAMLSRYIFDDLKRISRERSQEFAIVYLPTIRDMRSKGASLAPWLREVAQAQGIAFVDVAAELGSLEPGLLQDLFLDNGHFSARGNRLVASILALQLAKIFPEFAASVGSEKLPR